jgi:hypothetical protein
VLREKSLRWVGAWLLLLHGALFTAYHLVTLGRVIYLL